MGGLDMNGILFNHELIKNPILCWYSQYLTYAFTPIPIYTLPQLPIYALQKN